MESMGMPASRRIPMYRRAARYVTRSLSASWSAVVPRRVWRISRARSARAVGLSSVCTGADEAVTGVNRKWIVRNWLYREVS